DPGALQGHIRTEHAHPEVSGSQIVAQHSGQYNANRARHQHGQDGHDEWFSAENADGRTVEAYLSAAGVQWRQQADAPFSLSRHQIAGWLLMEASVEAKAFCRLERLTEPGISDWSW